MNAGCYLIIFPTVNHVYVGSSNRCDYRLGQHRRALMNGKHQNIHLQRLIDKYGIDSYITKTFSCNLDERLSLEYELIGLMIDENAKLVNFKIVDEGGVISFSDESREKMRQSSLKNWEANREHMLSTCHSKEVKEVRKRAAQTRKKVVLPVEHYQNAAKKAWELHRDKLTAQASEISLKNWQNPDYVANIKEKRKAMWQNPEHKAKVDETRAKNGTNAKHGELVKAQWADPIFRAKMMEARRVAKEAKQSKLYGQSAAKS